VTDPDVTEPVRLLAGELEATLSIEGPTFSVVSLRHRGAELLLAPEELPPGYRLHSALAGITLMHPWAGRLSRDRFEVGGVEVVLPADAPEVSRDPVSGVPLHGLRSGGAWTLVAEAASESGVADGTRATATLDFGAQPELLARFPFPHELTIAAELRPDGLALSTELRATGDLAVPVAFGWHPYARLPATPRAEWRLQLPEGAHIPLDERKLPTGARAARSPATRVVLDERAFDDGWDGIADGAVLAAADDVRELRCEFLGGFRVAQLFAPLDAELVSLEPMTAVGNALVSGDGLRFAAPGTTFTARTLFAVLDAAGSA
jgi:galactose mutarotase-like enzyme